MNELIALPMEQRQQSIIYAVQNYGKRLFSFIRNRVKNDQDAEDILQDVWYQLSSIIDTEPIEQLSAWLFRVSRNKIVDKKRKQSTLSLEDLAYEDEDGEMGFTEALLSGGLNPEEELENTFIKEMFFEALSELPEKQRYVFVMNELEDISLQEIANQTGENIKTIISRKGYAVKYLREKMKDLYSDFFGS